MNRLIKSKDMMFVDNSCIDSTVFKKSQDLKTLEPRKK